jgi:RimJ/RimL family protein N-acetyltransferase
LIEVHQAYYSFWAQAFGLSEAQIRSPNSQLVTTGKYLERHGDRFIYFYLDLINHKKILACTPVQQKRFGFSLEDLTQMDMDSVRNFKGLRDLHLAFRDIDYFLPAKVSLARQTEKTIQPLSAESTSSVTRFYAHCSEDEIDTLDLRLGEDWALGLFATGEIAGVARYTRIPNSPDLADITVVVQQQWRGRGFASALTAELLLDLAAQGLLPKYRGAEDNLPSRAIAEKLGLVPGFRLLAFS